MTPRIEASPEALFRYVVVSSVLSRMALGKPLAIAVREVASQPHPTLDGTTRTTTTRTLYRWIAGWRERGIAGLEPAVRCPATASRVLSNELLAFVASQKRDDQAASFPEILKRARLEGIISEDERIDRVTVWRAARRMGVDVQRRKKPHDGDTRRFEYPNRMQMVLSDGKHFRAGATRTKRVALFFLDDASRFGMDVVVGPSESAAVFLRGVHGVVRRHGLFDACYLDHGPGFIALDTAEILRNLGALLILGVVGYPEGRGKIERFNKTALAAVLRSLDRRPDVDPDCGALQVRLGHWLREVYNHEQHESLDATPWQRWSADTRQLRFPPDGTHLDAHFVLRETRRVTADHTVPWDGVDLEVPKGYAGKTVELRHNVLDDTVHLPHGDRLIRLQPVDPHRNAVSGRGHRPTPTPPAGPLPPSAADLAFRRDLAPLVGPDGGFDGPEPEPEVP